MLEANEKLLFDPEKYAVKQTEDGFEYCSWEGLDYVAKPADPIQKVNVFAPVAYAKGEKCGAYSRETAPIFMPNTVGGYMPGPRDYPGNKNFPSNSKTIVAALKRGYVVNFSWPARTDFGKRQGASLYRRHEGSSSLG